MIPKLLYYGRIPESEKIVFDGVFVFAAQRNASGRV